MNEIPVWSLAPFILVVLSVAILPALFPHFWKKYNLLWLAALALPILAMVSALSPLLVVDTFIDYVSFISLLGALYSIGGGLFISGTAKANPFVNMRYMIIGAIIANVIGTLGASMILIRPLLRANRGRKHEAHVILFFIFIVSNVGGLLSPLGDPPLLLGFLNGVPFSWTFKLVEIWLFAVTALTGIFLALDSYFFLEDPDFRGPAKMEVAEPIHVTGRWNIGLIILVLGALTLPTLLPEEFSQWRHFIRIGMLLLTTWLSQKQTPELVKKLNHFSWEPMIEVAVIFASIFATMIPATQYLSAHAGDLGLQTPKAFFWFSGIVSSVLDNAPSYAAFFSVAKGLTVEGAQVALHHGQKISESLLSAISAGTVFFGSMTYIGNAPNLLVKSVAEENDIKMPSFFSYILWSVVFVLPVLFLTSVFFFE
jgi:Na+/H+ antiporter NhaD/arsenite permease-like protein